MQLVPAYLQLITIFVLGSSVILQLRANDRRAREAHTLSLLGTLTLDEGLRNAHALVHSLYADKRKAVSELSSNEEAQLFGLLSHYEYIAIAYFANTVDRDVVLRQRARSLEITYELVVDLMEERRNVLKAPGLYSQFEQLATQEIARYRRKRGTGAF